MGIAAWSEIKAVRALPILIVLAIFAKDQSAVYAFIFRIIGAANIARAAAALSAHGISTAAILVAPAAIAFIAKSIAMAEFMY